MQVFASAVGYLVVAIVSMVTLVEFRLVFALPLAFISLFCLWYVIEERRAIHPLGTLHYFGVPVPKRYWPNIRNERP